MTSTVAPIRAPLNIRRRVLRTIYAACRVYFRAGVLEDLDERRTRCLSLRVIKAQAAWRAYVCRRSVHHTFQL